MCNSSYSATIDFGLSDGSVAESPVPDREGKIVEEVTETLVAGDVLSLEALEPGAGAKQRLSKSQPCRHYRYHLFSKTGDADTKKDGTYPFQGDSEAGNQFEHSELLFIPIGRRPRPYLHC